MHLRLRIGLVGLIVAAMTGGIVMTTGPGAAQAVVPTQTATFGPGAASWVVPSHVSDVTATLDGAAGRANVDFYPAEAGGAGGDVTVDLGSGWSGKRLFFSVGGIGAGSLANPSSRTGVAGGGGGTFLADGIGLLAVAGGGGGAGGWFDITTGGEEGTSGGAGGVALTAGGAGAGSPGSYGAFLSSVGDGATGLTPGAAGIGNNPAEYSGSAGQSVTAAIGGVPTPSLGGWGSDHGGAGGGGYAGGGGGSAFGGTVRSSGDAAIEYPSGGGGSGFLAPGLTGTQTTNQQAGNPVTGSITFSYRFSLGYTPPPSITVDTVSVVQGGTLAATIAGLPATTRYTVDLDSLPVQVFTGTTDTNGTATIVLTIPADTAPGSHTLTVATGGIIQATSEPFAVTSVLATTGADLGWWPLVGGMLVLAGLGLVLTAWKRPQQVMRK